MGVRASKNGDPFAGFRISPEEQRKRTLNKMNEAIERIVESRPPAARDRLREYIANIPDRHRNKWARGADPENTNQRLRIDAHCLSCVGFEDVEDRVGNCQAQLCEFLTNRPYQRKVQ